MRRSVTFGIVVIAGLGLATAMAQESAPSRRHGVFLNLRLYPQGAPKETLASVLSALGQGRVDYVLAQLTDPAFVDDHAARFYRGDFDQLVGEASLKLADDPSFVQLLARFLKEGEWQENDTTATSRLKDIPDRRVNLRRVGAGWYLENRQG
jgi:hypothetical protein